MAEWGKLRRSLLHVSGGDLGAIDRARSSRADTVVFDLEDSVGLEEKYRARKQVVDALHQRDFGSSELAVRLNATDTPHFKPDLEAVLTAGARTVFLPKCERPDEVEHVSTLVDAVEQKLGIAAHAVVRLIVLIETARGIAFARELGEATERVDALCFGHNDFALDMGLPNADPSDGIMLHARCQLVIAAKAAGVGTIDNACPTVGEDEVFRADAVLGARLGFEGKVCLDAAQVEIANEVYTPTAQQVEYAHRIVEAWRSAQEEGCSILRLDNKVIDAPLVAVQERLLARARRAGVFGEDQEHETAASDDDDTHEGLNGYCE